MVKDLLNLSKLESDKLEINFNKLDVNMLINDTIRSLNPLINVKMLELQLALQNNIPPLFSDYDKLKQLLIIFLDNGIKFSKNKGKLKVSTYCDDKNINIAIEDNGIGIPKNEVQYLGEKFVNLPSLKYTPILLERYARCLINTNDFINIKNEIESNMYDDFICEQLAKGDLSYDEFKSKMIGEQKNEKQ